MTISLFSIEWWIYHCHNTYTHIDGKLKHFHKYLYRNCFTNFDVLNLFSEYCRRVTGHPVYTKFKLCHKSKRFANFFNVIVNDEEISKRVKKRNRLRIPRKRLHCGGQKRETTDRCKKWNYCAARVLWMAMGSSLNYKPHFTLIVAF